MSNDSLMILTDKLRNGTCDVCCGCCWHGLGHCTQVSDISAHFHAWPRLNRQRKNAKINLTEEVCNRLNNIIIGIFIIVIHNRMCICYCTHFQVVPCPYVGTQKGSDGEGTVQSHDLSHHILVLDTLLPSSLIWILLWWKRSKKEGAEHKCTSRSLVWNYYLSHLIVMLSNLSVVAPCLENAVCVSEMLQQFT